MAMKDVIDRLLVLRGRNQSVIELSEEHPVTMELQADQFFIVDPTDKTKRLGFDVSGLATGTTQTSGRVSVIDTGGAFATPIVLTAADSGKVYLLDDAAGLDFTLPAVTASNLGMRFTFFLVTEVTSNSYRFTAQSGDLLVGHVITVDKDQVEGSTEALQQLNRPDGSDDLILTITGSDDTQGSLVGGWLEFTAVTATRWFVRGSLIGDGALAQIFS